MESQSGLEIASIYTTMKHTIMSVIANSTTTDTSTFISKRSADDFKTIELHGSNDSLKNSTPLADTIAAIRSNLTWLFKMYLQNATEEFNIDDDGETTTSITVKSLNGVMNSTEAILGQTQPKSLPATIKYPVYPITVRNYENCSAIFSDYGHPQGVFCNWTWDQFLCWPPTPAGALAYMSCPAGWIAIDTRKFANRKCNADGNWGARPNESLNSKASNGWTDYQPCFSPEVNELLQKMKNPDLFVDIAKRTRTLEIVGLMVSLFALIISLTIFCNFRTLRNNRTKIHKNLFIAMVLQVLVRLILYLDQAFRRGTSEATKNFGSTGIENTPYLCEASYVLLEYARTSMFFWMFIEGLYLHNMVATVAVFQNDITVFRRICWIFAWGFPSVLTCIWATCTAYTHLDTSDCWFNYWLLEYYWILEGPRLLVILLNFFFLINIIRVLVVKLRQSQARAHEQTRKAVRAAFVLLPLLGISNLLHLVPPDLDTPWKFALWSYVTHFLTSFQGFFISLIYCFLNGEVRAALLKSLAVYMSQRGHPDWVPKHASMFSGYNTAPDTEAPPEGKRHGMPTTEEQTRIESCQRPKNRRYHWLTWCFQKGQKVLRPPASTAPESVVFELSEH